MFKIQLADGFYKNKSGRIQHFSNKEKVDAKIKKLGIDATVVECKPKTASATKQPKETASDAKVLKVIKTNKAASKPEKPASSKDKTKKNKKA